MGLEDEPMVSTSSPGAKDKPMASRVESRGFVNRGGQES